MQIEINFGLKEGGLHPAVVRLHCKENVRKEKQITDQESLTHLDHEQRRAKSELVSC